MEGEKRRSPRQPLNYPAKIDIGDGTPAFACVLTDVSATGARVIVEAADKIPDRFSLLLAPEHGALRRCKVVWREADELGLTFMKFPVVKNNRRPRPGSRDSLRGV